MKNYGQTCLNQIKKLAYLGYYMDLLEKFFNG